MKNWEKAKEYIRQGMDYCGRVHGDKSVQMVKMKVEMSKIAAEEKDYQQAITELDSAIGTSLSTLQRP